MLKMLKNVEKIWESWQMLKMLKCCRNFKFGCSSADFPLFCCFRWFSTIFREFPWHLRTTPSNNLRTTFEQLVLDVVLLVFTKEKQLSNNSHGTASNNPRTTFEQPSGDRPVGPPRGRPGRLLLIFCHTRRFSMIFHDFHWFFMIFNEFQLFYWFSMILLNFNDFQWISKICVTPVKCETVLLWNMTSQTQRHKIVGFEAAFAVPFCNAGDSQQRRSAPPSVQRRQARNQ